MTTVTPLPLDIELLRNLRKKGHILIAENLLRKYHKRIVDDRTRLKAEFISNLNEYKVNNGLCRRMENCLRPVIPGTKQCETCRDSHNKWYYERVKKSKVEGICYRCATSGLYKDSEFCVDCYISNYIKSVEYQDKYKKKGLCYRCRKRESGIENRVCLVCAYNYKYTYQLKKEMGVCVHAGCRKRAIPGKARCIACLARNRSYQSRKRMLDDAKNNTLR